MPYDYFDNNHRYIRLMVLSLELKQLQTFRTLALELNFTKTAQVSNYAQLSVSAQIQALESELGTQLFERIGKRVTLTQAGERLKSYADEILRLADEALVAVPNHCEPTGTLTIGSVESLCTYRLSPILRQYRSLYPKMELIFRTGICSDLRKAVLDGSLDAVLTLEPIVSSESLVSEQLLQEPMLVLAHVHHPLVQYEQVRPLDLEGETILVTEPGCSYREMFERSLAEAGIRTPMKIEFASIEAIKQCVMAGLGIAILPEMAVIKEVHQQELTALRWDGAEFQIITQMCWHKDKWMSPALTAFLKLIRESLRSVSPT